MIVFDLECRSGGHRFEGWFGSSEEYARQQERGLVACPECSSSDIVKAPMAPNVERKGNQMSTQGAAVKPLEMPTALPVPVAKGAMPAEALKMMKALATMQAQALEKSRWVGDDFVETSRKMHYGERAVEPIHGQATIQEARELLDEGIEVSSLPFPVTPPGEGN